MEVIAVIIARGGSKRVPRKNVQPICGLPLVAWSVVQAVCSRSVNHVYLSTDDAEIGHVGKIYGAEIIRRPEWSDADQVAGNRPYRHAVDVLKPRHGMEYCLVQLLPTSPQRRPDDIDRGVAMWMQSRGHVFGASVKRETFLYRNIGGVVARPAIRDKYARYLDLCSGIINVVDPSNYAWLTDNMPSDHDADLNAAAAGGEYLEDDMYWIECQPWQVFETDTPVEFELTEQIFEHFVLKGRGTDVYYEYAEGK